MSQIGHCVRHLLPEVMALFSVATSSGLTFRSLRWVCSVRINCEVSVGLPSVVLTRIVRMVAPGSVSSR